MRVDKARSGEGRLAMPEASPYRKQAAREARKRETARAVGAFFTDIQTGVIVALFMFAIGIISLYGLRMMGYENEMVALKHLAAGADCSVAEFVGLAPAKMDEPGYWMHLDVDKDGTTCEEG